MPLTGALLRCIICVPMIRTQIFLTRQEYEGLKRLAYLRGQTYSSVLRGYLDQALGISTHQKFLDVLEEFAGSVSAPDIKRMKRRVKRVRALW